MRGLAMNINEITIYYGMLFKKKDNKYYCNGAFGRFIDELSKRYNKIYLVVPVHVINTIERELDYCINSKNIFVQELPEYSGFISAYKNFRVIKKSILRYSELWNGSVYIRWPVPFFNYVHKIAQDKSLPVVFHLVGDTKAVVVNGKKYKGLIRWIAIKMADYDSIVMRKLLKNTPAMVNGSGLRRLYSPENTKIKEIRTSTISMNEIEEPKNKLRNKSVKLLFVGYLRHEKGLEYLLKAVKYLRDLGMDLELSLVGDGDNREELENLTKKLHIEDLVRFKGYISFGDQLLNMYRESDIFVLSSISEGTPRVLIEAMSKGLPVIATDVGGIPYTIKDGYNGLLVPPKDSEAIAKSILRIYKNENMRSKLIDNGLSFAKENTLECHVEQVYKFIQVNNSINGGEYDTNK